ncbi:MAG: hypothetical protein ISP45_15715 [Reyranella sp.]|nr:hypothetical protein [Reyranella sp.]
MARFMIRVELHYAPLDGDDYAKLHEEMESRGFARTISSSDATYHLPPAMYAIDGDYDRSGVLQAAKDCAAAVGYTAWTSGSRGQRTYSIVVTEAVASTWAGLEKV